MRHIGGSILPSSDPRILQPIGSLQVRAIPEQDTYGLFDGDRLIASHPNGYSCHELAKLMLMGDPKRIREQKDCIVACGGFVDETR